MGSPGSDVIRGGAHLGCLGSKRPLYRGRHNGAAPLTQLRLPSAMCLSYNPNKQLPAALHALPPHVRQLPLCHHAPPYKNTSAHLPQEVERWWGPPTVVGDHEGQPLVQHSPPEQTPLEYAAEYSFYFTTFPDESCPPEPL